LIFLDTSVLVATAQVSHPHHTPSRELWNVCAREETAVSSHTLAEIYSTLTGMPPGLRLAPRDAVAAIETFLKRLTPVTLSPEEYLQAMRRTAKLGHSGGMIYDALHLACARKVDAQHIYTWNQKHFRLVAPDLADRITTP
jgi:predicted nucleic acid-binding protein